MERLLNKMLASVDQNMLCLIRVSLKEREKTASAPPTSFMHSHPLLHFISAALVLG
jgi:hypothetical protein